MRRGPVDSSISGARTTPAGSQLVHSRPGTTPTRRRERSKLIHSNYDVFHSPSPCHGLLAAFPSAKPCSSLLGEDAQGITEDGHLAMLPRPWMPLEENLRVGGLDVGGTRPPSRVSSATGRRDTIMQPGLVRHHVNGTSFVDSGKGSLRVSPKETCVTQEASPNLTSVERSIIRRESMERAAATIEKMIDIIPEGSYMLPQGNQKSGSCPSTRPSSVNTKYRNHHVLQIPTHALELPPTNRVEMKPVSRSPSPSRAAMRSAASDRSRARSESASWSRPTSPGMHRGSADMGSPPPSYKHGGAAPHPSPAFAAAGPPRGLVNV